MIYNLLIFNECTEKKPCQGIKFGRISRDFEGQITTRCAHYFAETLPVVAESLRQIVMGWENYHLHQFIAGEQYFGVLDPDFPMDVKDETRLKLKGLLPKEGASAVYEYDFGEGWEHKLKLEKVLPFEEDKPLPCCIKGKRACPPEDCGGVFGYKHLLEAISDPGHPDHADLSEWLSEGFDPEHFDASVINSRLGKYFGKKPSSLGSG